MKVGLGPGIKPTLSSSVHGGRQPDRRQNALERVPLLSSKTLCVAISRKIGIRCHEGPTGRAGKKNELLAFSRPSKRYSKDSKIRTIAEVLQRALPAELQCYLEPKDWFVAWSKITKSQFTRTPTPLQGKGEFNTWSWRGRNDMQPIAVFTGQSDIKHLFLVA
ncbi:hypothetical protein CROQUDRAFT_89429 [Cronartium quercuum f. sp. fusiforme G11]|uniref:Uncharacterized protein n=1 Tax=Cronartium quercuum f. sp. fusiforme G11 TaxID=708437 RepID=A0A9P6NTA3_9BASI|nr:hypothetical protein CROQUDRAFT_89429 [Cronartium quercuum f. sp. fusiforme G11]